MPSPRKRILVVDDYPEAAETTCILLELLGHETRAAHTGCEALDTARSFEPEIVMLDIGLPDLSGYEVARALRQRPGGKRLHLAAVTGWGQSADRARAVAAGFDQHVLKPTDAIKVQSILDCAAARR